MKRVSGVKIKAPRSAKNIPEVKLLSPIKKLIAIYFKHQKANKLYIAYVPICK
jgi:hypothetical protein